MIKIIGDINIDPIREEYSRLDPGIVWSEFGHKGKQTGLQYRESEDPWTSAVGKGRGLDLTCFNLNNFFKDTIFEKIINDYSFFRTRLMWVYPYACYSMHKDLTPRIHIPLITNSDCYFLFKEMPPQHLPAGKIYFVNTKEEHTFVNCSNQPRLHLVGLIK